jgi:hypothetical protein
LFCGIALPARAASTCIVAGCAVFLAFWDLDNWMLVGSVLLLLGLAMSRPSREKSDVGLAQ